MIEKVIPSHSQDRLVEAVGQMIQVYESSRHIKSAASPLYSRADLEGYAPPKGQFLTHLVTMGSFEQYGENRNYDGWGHEQLLNKHATFETHARNYREHRNTDPRLAVGQIKSARYSPELQRGEILMWTDISKAPEEFERARRGADQSGSMAASVREDVCGVCDFVSSKPSQRCDCIRLSPGKYFHNKKAYAVMHNIEPTFKDYSWVRRPADRIAHHMNYLMPGHAKAASAEEVRNLRGDELAQFYGLVENPSLVTLQQIHAAGELEGEMDLSKRAFIQHVAPYAVTSHLDDATLSKMAAADPGKVMRELIDRDMVLPLADFNSWIHNVGLSTSINDAVVKEASEKMSSIRTIVIRRISKSPEASQAFDEATDLMAPALPGCGCSPGDAVSSFFEKVRDKFSTRYEVLRKNATVSVNDGYAPVVSTAEPSKEAVALGTLYQAYLVKTASHSHKSFESHSVLAAMR